MLLYLHWWRRDEGLPDARPRPLREFQFTAPPPDSQAMQQTGIAVAAALVFCAGVFFVRGGADASAWLAAYVLEESLSVDNLFVFTLIFDYFQTPTSAQPRVLRWGLIAAVVLRAAFIFAGLAVVEQFKVRRPPHPGRASRTVLLPLAAARSGAAARASTRRGRA